MQTFPNLNKKPGSFCSVYSEDVPNDRTRFLFDLGLNGNMNSNNIFDNLKLHLFGISEMFYKSVSQLRIK